MTNYEIFSVLLSCFAIIIAIYSTIKSFHANNIAKNTLELNIGLHINTARESVNNISAQMTPILSKNNLSASEKKQLEKLQYIFKSSIEGYLNTFETACSKFNNKEIDQEKFANLYRREIRQLVENKDFNDYFRPPQMRYENLLEVYKKLESMV